VYLNFYQIRWKAVPSTSQPTFSPKPGSSTSSTVSTLLTNQFSFLLGAVSTFSVHLCTHYAMETQKLLPFEIEIGDDDLDFNLRQHTVFYLADAEQNQYVLSALRLAIFRLRLLPGHS
jgi:hypothetical protein